MCRQFNAIKGLETDMSVLFIQIDARTGQREVLILDEANPSAVFTISRSLCGQQVRLFVNNHKLKQYKM